MDNKTKKILQRTAQRISRQRIVMQIDEQSSDCFCGPSGNVYRIHIGTKIAKCGISTLSDEDIFFKLVGATAHEAGHARFTNFEPICNVINASQEAKQNVTKLAQDWKYTNDDALLDKIKEEVYRYMYNTYLYKMDNSYEDAFVESEIIRNCSKIPFVYNGITKLREDITLLEDKCISNALKTNNMSNKDILESIITDMRHMAVIGYKNYPCEYNMLYEYYTDDECNDMMDVAMYARLGSHNSFDVLAAAKTAMKYIEEYIRKLSVEYAENYISKLQSSGDDDTSLFSDEATENDMVIAKENANSNPGKTHQRTPEFQLNLPSDVENEIQQNGGDTSNTSTSDSNSESSSADCQSNSNFGNSDNIENPQENSEHTTTADDSEKTDENPQNRDNSPQEGNSSDSDESNAKQGSNNFNDEENNKITINTTDLRNQLSSQEQIASKKALADSMSELKKMKKQQAESAIKDAVGGESRSPKLNGNLGDIDNISNLHRGIDIEYISPTKFKKMDMFYPLENELAEAKKISNKYANRFKKVLFQETRNKKISNLDKGNIDKRNLYHIITDGKCCYKKIDGKRSGARICILVDQSGSMHGSKADNSCIATNMLVNVARRLHIPISVFGHSYTKNEVTLRHFLDYDSPKSYDTNLNHIIDCNGCNHDSIPIFQCLTDMARHKKNNENCLFIVISDGAPNGRNDYQGKVAFEDIQNIYSIFEKKYGIKTIGVGIGDDVDCVPDIYKNFIIIPDTNELPAALLDLLKKTI